MEYKQIQELIKTINKSNISELSIKDGDFEITIKQTQAAPEMQFVAMHQQQPVHTMMQQSQMGQQQPMQTLPQPTAQPQEQPAKQPAESSAKTVTVKSPMIGTFYRSPSPDKPALAEVGQEIKPGKVICIIEAMKLFNEIESEVSGRIIKVLVDDASPVEYDQPLFLVEPA